MTSYLSYKFEDSPSFVNTFDELPLWSASFGLLLLKHLDYKQGLTILDIGSGAGFPLMEIAARFGPGSTCYGLDVWTNANERAKQKSINYGLGNVTVIEGSADDIPFADNTFDLVVSNLGINNFENPALVFSQCNRVLKPRGKLCITTNLNGHWSLFYKVFEDVLTESGRGHVVEKLKSHQEHRGTVESISALFTQNGFDAIRSFNEDFDMKFTDGTAFLNHYFVKLGWLSSWIVLLEGENVEEIFALIEKKLNEIATASNGLTLNVPMAFIEGRKQV